MRKNIRLLVLAFVAFGSVNAQTDFQPNYDESKVGTYELPSILLSDDGSQVRTVTQWENSRKGEILQKFEDYVYGKFPQRLTDTHYEITSVKKNALNGKALRKEVTVHFTKDKTGPALHILMYLPKTNKPCPVFVGLNFFGNHTISHERDIKLPEQWVANSQSIGIVDNRATEQSRGAQAQRWPLEQILAANFGVVTAYYGDLEPDHPDGWKQGIRSTLQTQLNIKPEEWSAIGAWAWGLSRIMDYLETDKDIKASQVALMGHSRLGKAALWAGANDQRFAIVISNESGEGGAALTRRNYGETIKRINTAFPHWFIYRYKEYNDSPDKLPLDQHMLLALMAPRPLYVASAEEDQWADPRGEFLSLLQAEEVYKLYNLPGLGVSTMPSIEKPVGETLRYHIRSGKHDVTRYDWEQYLKFAARHFKR